MLATDPDIAAPTAIAAACGHPFRGLFARALGRVQHAVCGLHGHDALLHFDRDRLFLRCTSCGYETPGWTIGRNPPRVRFRGAARRAPLGHRPPVSETRQLVSCRSNV